MASRSQASFSSALLLASACALGGWAFGETGTPEAVDSGFVFHNGAYLRAPYEIECADRSLYVNGVPILTGPRPPAVLAVTEDPGLPQGLSREATLDDLRAVKWKGRMPYYTAKLAYLWDRFGREEAQERMIHYYRSLPCVREAVRVEGDGVRLTDYRGNSRVIDLYIPERALEVREDEEDLRQEFFRQELLKLADIYRDRLAKGDCFFFFDNGTEISVTERKAASVLAEMQEIVLDPGRPRAAKTRDLLSLGLIPEHDLALAEWVLAEFRQDRQLDDRLSALKTKLAEE